MYVVQQISIWILSRRYVSNLSNLISLGITVVDGHSPEIDVKPAHNHARVPSLFFLSMVPELERASDGLQGR